MRNYAIILGAAGGGAALAVGLSMMARGSADPLDVVSASCVFAVTAAIVAGLLAGVGRGRRR